MIPAATVQCPDCGAAYLLPRALLGPLGARVTCPRCRTTFELDRDGVPAAAKPAAGGPVAESGAAACAIAAAVLDALSAAAGARLDRSAAEGRLFRDHGPALAAAFDECVTRAGPGPGAEAFREELGRRWENLRIPPP